LDLDIDTEAALHILLLSVSHTLPLQLHNSVTAQLQQATATTLAAEASAPFAVNAVYEALFTAEALSVCESRQDSIAALFSDMLLEQQQLQQQQQQEQRQECQSDNDNGVALVPVVAAATLLLRFEQARLVSCYKRCVLEQYCL
jgi:hypothetical protein